MLSICVLQLCPFLYFFLLKATTSPSPKTQFLTHFSYNTRNDNKITDSHRIGKTIILPHRDTKQQEYGKIQVEVPQHGTKIPKHKKQHKNSTKK
jgi:hypothetical protein